MRGGERAVAGAKGKTPPYRQQRAIRTGHPDGWLFGGAEDEGETTINLNFLVVDGVGTKTPLLGGFDGGVGKGRVAGIEFDGNGDTVFVNEKVQDDHAGAVGVLRVKRSDFLHDQFAQDAFGDADTKMFRRLGVLRERS